MASGSQLSQALKTSVVVPSFHEDPYVLERCLDTWLDQGPEAAPDVLDAFRGWATDPYFGE